MKFQLEGNQLEINNLIFCIFKTCEYEQSCLYSYKQEVKIYLFTVGRIVSDHKSRKKEEKIIRFWIETFIFVGFFFSRALKSKAIARYGKWEDQIRLSLAVTKHRNKTYCISFLKLYLACWMLQSDSIVTRVKLKEH